MNPPTVMVALQEYLAMLSPEMDTQSLSDVTELSRFLSELSVCDYFFVTKTPSSIALACVLTSFEGVSHEDLPRNLRQRFVNDVFRIAKINCTIEEVHLARLRLRDIYERGNYHKPKGSAGNRGDRNGGRSPVNITDRHVVDEAEDADMGGSEMPSVPISRSTRSRQRSAAQSHEHQHQPVQMHSRYVSDEPIEQ